MAEQLPGMLQVVITDINLLYFSLQESSLQERFSGETSSWRVYLVC